jgi:hypothetical protein
MIKLLDILNEAISEMGMNDWGVENVKKAYESGNEDMKDKISVAFTKESNQSWEKIKKSISEMGKEDFDKKLDDLGLYNLEEEKPGLWANIRAKRARGEKPARKGTKAYNSAVKAAK